MKITTYVFSTKDPPVKKIYDYQHKTGIAPDPPSSQQKKDVSIEALHTRDMLCNTAKKHYLMQHVNLTLIQPGPD